MHILYYIPSTGTYLQFNYFIQYSMIESDRDRHRVFESDPYTRLIHENKYHVIVSSSSLPTPESILYSKNMETGELYGTRPATFIPEIPLGYSYAVPLLRTCNFEEVD